MECDKEEAQRAMEIAEKKLRTKDYVGAKIFAYKAQKLYPKLQGLTQFLAMVDVYTCSSNGDWYGILGLDPSADEETVKRQYKSLALLLHPDKNKIDGAEGAFKLVSDAWRLVSDKAKRSVYDRQRRSKQVKQRKKTDTCSTWVFDSQRWFEDSRKQFAENPINPKAVDERLRRWYEEGQKDMDAAVASAKANANKAHEQEVKSKKEKPDANQAEDILKRWLDKSRKHVDAAVAVAKANANRAKSAYDLKRKSREDDHNANQARQRVKTWLDKSERDVHAAVAAAAARENATSTSQAEMHFKKPLMV